MINALGGQKFGKGFRQKGNPLSKKNHLGSPYCKKKVLQVID